MISQRKRAGRLSWVYEHLRMTVRHSIDRVPLPEKGEHVEMRGRKATGQSWVLIAGLPKDSKIKGQGRRQFIPGRLSYWLY